MNRLYSIYKGIKQRCYNPNHNSYKYYGLMGIKISPLWIKDFKIFEAWAIKNGYADDLQIDRKDSTKDYSPDNCRWVTSQIQNRNTKIRVSNKTGVKGCYYEKRASKYRQQIKVNGKNISLGNFKTIEECKLAREKYIIDNNIEQ